MAYVVTGIIIVLGIVGIYLQYKARTDRRPVNLLRVLAFLVGALCFLVLFVLRG